MEEKEQLEQLVKESSSLAEILRKQGKNPSGAAYKILKEKLDTYNISYHFISQRNGNYGKLSLDERLKENRPYNSSKLRKRLIDEKLKENKCELCGQLPFHNGKELVLQLDHINGDHNDNRLENLRILCPNCHSQTETYSSKVRVKNIKTCPDCGAIIKNTSTYCVKCAPFHKRSLKDIKPSKEKLLELIKENSFLKVGEIIGTTENTIRKWCREYNLPGTKSELKEYLLNSLSVSAGADKA